MGGLDFFCAVSGTTHIGYEEVIAKSIFGFHNPEEFAPDEDTPAPGGKKWHAPSDGVLEGLNFLPEDMEASKDCVLIAGIAPPSESDEDDSRTETLYCDQEVAVDIEITDMARAKYLFNITSSDEGLYEDPSDTGTWYSIWQQGSAYYVTFPAFCILQTVIPGLDASTLYRTLVHGIQTGNVHDAHNGFPSEIDYGDIVVRTFGQYVNWLGVSEEEGIAWDGWLDLLCYDPRSEEEILDEAWNGKGNLWVYKRPDRFPVAKALAASELSEFPITREAGAPCPCLDRLPLDILLTIGQELPLSGILSLLRVNKRLRALIFPHKDEMAYHAIKLNEPWYLPSNPIKTPDGTREREDLDWWEEEWRLEGGLEADEIRSKAPWLKYWIQCVRDPSMRNRKRVWRSAESIKALAVKLGYL